MFTTYNTLTTKIMNTLDKTDASTLAQVPNFIYQTEIKMCEFIKTLGVEDYVTGVFSVGVPVLPFPARLRRMISFNFGTGTDFNNRTPIKMRSREYCVSYGPNEATLGEPKFYCDYGPYNFFVTPTPDQAYPFELAFMGLPEPITVANQTNWFTNFAPNALFYGCMVEANRYLKNFAAAAQWDAAFKEAAAILQNTDNLRKEDRGANRDAD